MTSRKLRIRFTKTGDLRLTGHLDLARAWERLFRRAGAPLAMSGGFHPRPRIHFPSALPMGEAGTDEVVDVELNVDSVQTVSVGNAEASEPNAVQTYDDLLEALRRAAPAGLFPVRIEELPSGAPHSTAREVDYEFPLPREWQAEVTGRVERLLARPTFWVERREKRAVDMRDYLLGASVEEGRLRFRLRVAREGSLRARDVLSALELTELQESGSFATRSSVRLA
ncbi:MAG TPA: TIGR03936 family radical SAM-associated protein [Pirellulales bacterium]|jgi:radical SAM-linked protein